MVDSNSPEFKVGKKIGQLFMTYIGIKLIIKGGKLVLKNAKALIFPASPI